MAKIMRYAKRKDIETVVGVLVEYLQSNAGTDMIVRLEGALTRDQLHGIEQGILLVTGRAVQLACDEIDEEEGHYWLLGIVNETTPSLSN